MPTDGVTRRRRDLDAEPSHATWSSPSSPRFESAIAGRERNQRWRAYEHQQVESLVPEAIPVGLALDATAPGCWPLQGSLDRPRVFSRLQDAVAEVAAHCPCGAFTSTVSGTLAITIWSVRRPRSSGVGDAVVGRRAGWQAELCRADVG